MLPQEGPGLRGLQVHDLQGSPDTDTVHPGETVPDPRNRSRDKAQSHTRRHSSAQFLGSAQQLETSSDSLGHEDKNKYDKGIFREKRLKKVDISNPLHFREADPLDEEFLRTYTFHQGKVAGSEGYEQVWEVC